MSEKAKDEEMDRLLELLANPLTRAILIVLTGQDPGPYRIQRYLDDDDEDSGSNRPTNEDS
ncbi:MAG: hypothetical protein JSW61_03265 [Candidatus Thorarchaeota archaeon]|nr:MAG: hypothetical protein JSW61_03265 [Candidatus Thorarchaeota archaeon]